MRLVERTEQLARQFVRQHGVGTYVRAIETTTVTRTPWEDE